MKIVRYTKFPSNPFGDGGAKRSVQIEEYWQNQGYDITDEKFILPKKYSAFTAIGWVFRAVLFINKYVGWSKYKNIQKKQMLFYISH